MRLSFHYRYAVEGNKRRLRRYDLQQRSKSGSSSSERSALRARLQASLASLAEQEVTKFRRATAGKDYAAGRAMLLQQRQEALGAPFTKDADDTYLDSKEAEIWRQVLDDFEQDDVTAGVAPPATRSPLPPYAIAPDQPCRRPPQHKSRTVRGRPKFNRPPDSRVVAAAAAASKPATAAPAGASSAAATATCSKLESLPPGEREFLAVFGEAMVASSSSEDEL